LAFAAGAALVAASAEALVGDALADMLAEWRVSHVTLPPSVVATLVLFAATEGTDTVVGPDIWTEYVDQPIDYHRMPCTHAGILKSESLAFIGPIGEEQLREN
jgi:hypothetical protein